VRVEVLLFGAARDAAGARTLALDVPEPVDVAAVATALRAASATLAPLLSGCRFAVDREFADAGTPVRAGAEVALLPPVSGG
jgi:molybdopterin converting factor small subunit